MCASDNLEAPDVESVVIEGIGEKFSLRKFLSFVGPGFVMAIAYVDPANFESDMVAGVQYGCKLLWVLLWATVAGFFIQTLAIRLALGSGQHLAQACRHEYPRLVRYALWFLAEVTVVASDIPEVIGSAIGLRLLFGTPTWVGIIITAVDSLFFLAVGAYGVRKVEAIMCFFVAAMSVAWAVELGRADYDAGEVAIGILRPAIPDSQAMFIAVSLLGAVVMPHNLFLHSGLVLSRKIPQSDKSIRMALTYNNLESAIALGVTLFINVAVVVVSAATVNSPLVSEEMKDEILQRPLLSGPQMLRTVLGRAADTLFAVALLASGQSSTITGTYAGEFVMLGFLDFSVPRHLRSLLCRLCAILPALVVALTAGEAGTEKLIVFCSVILSFQLPFALIPLLKFCGNEGMLGALAVKDNGLKALWALATGVVLANIYLMTWAIIGSGSVDSSPGGVVTGSATAIGGCVYVGALVWLARKPVHQAYDHRNGDYRALEPDSGGKASELASVHAKPDESCAMMGKGSKRGHGRGAGGVTGEEEMLDDLCGKQPSRMDGTSSDSPKNGNCVPGYPSLGDGGEDESKANGCRGGGRWKEDREGLLLS